ncbi:MAG: enoyl-CoA hydratase/isomerase family protein [Pseudomonadales bacterium]
MSSDTVKVFEHDAGGGFVVAEARLDSESTLNALSLEMIDLLMPAVTAWEQDPRVAAVVLTGSGSRAFSAGGDIQALYRAMVANHQAGERVDDYPYEFFEREYRLDYRLHTYAKPLVALGHGVIMGGGLGIFSAADFRIVTENVRLAMPEVTIGLFPDAGGTWLLRQLPEHQALFIGMTGVNLNGGDAMAAGLGTHAVARTALDSMTDGLTALTFSGDAAADRDLIGGWLDGLSPPPLPAAELPAVADTLAADGGFAVAADAVRAMSGTSSWIDRGIATMERGCPTTVGIVVEQVRRARTLSLADCFRMEMTVATHCADNHDFSEGVRALLIEKDNAPSWQFGDLASLPAGYVLDHFVEPWQRNPLYDLENGS